MIEIDLRGKVALVTGASRKIGIGSAIARTLAQAGADIFTTYYTPYDRAMPWGVHLDEPAQLLAELRGFGVRAEAIEADLSEPSAPALIFERVESILGPVDILVNNATHDVYADIASLTMEGLDKHYTVNVRAVVLLCQLFAAHHDGRPGGRIINMVSGELLHPMTENLPYVITKGAVDALTITLSGSLAKKGITVNAVDPGATDTGWMPNEVYTWLQQNAPFGRVGLPQDAANLVLFLASPLGQWITGQILHSRGGFQ